VAESSATAPVGQLTKSEKGVSDLRRYYSEYVRHCLAYYIKTQDECDGGHPVFKNDVDRANWSACYHILKDYSEEDMITIAHIYRPGDTIADKIYQLAKSKRVSQDVIWGLVNNIERKIAKKRGLI
jgi:hypothetical protein